MRISGFASGFDIDQMVKELMAAHRKPADKIFQQQQLLEWKREDYREVNSQIIDFRNNKLSKYKLSSEIAAKMAVVSGDSSVLSAKASSTAASGTMTIKVNNLATSSNVKSLSSLGTDVPTNVTFDQLKADGAIAFNDNTFKINGVSISIDPAVDTIDSLVSKINNNKDAKVSAFFDSGSGRLSLNSKETGTGNITLEGDLLIGASGFDLNDATAGMDASLEVNGLAITRSSNTFSINDVEITLKGESVSQTTMISVETNTDKIMDTIKSFVNDYNALLSKVNSELGEERYRKYSPLTDEQKKEMEEDDIKRWEEKARSGMLNRDNILNKMVNDLRLSIIGDVGTAGSEVNITALGITTGSWSDRGKLVIDEDKLRAAIEADPDQVLNVFTKSGSGTGPDNPEKGIFNRMSDILKGTLSEISKKAGTSIVNMDDSYSFSASSTMGTELKWLESSMDNMNRRLQMLESRYYKQFTAMESAINRFNSQAGSLQNFMN